ncbi:uncharacterized protein A1O9_11786 [Exophiala aquamarina CBS 119918]|uniref:Transferrin receptor-like dimerisation domain-containing protein n=1 Tax=Exophiala aquamarina CBS 119918 TaxID=1182545 RepID=A0A072NW96_9EURO|nr:uncharacterized protein A1O9_11786 [Exophiala aquamarina CBS 119918]KEF52159.1 hypothetical protein A1O9_11786 [Exophiala aquamarina CBS 119918]
MAKDRAFLCSHFGLCHARASAPQGYPDDTVSRGLDETLQLVNVSLELCPLERAIAQLNASALARMAHIASGPIPGQAKDINAKLKDFSRAFVSQGDLLGRDFHKHVLFALGIESLYGAAIWPGISDVVAFGNLTLAQEWWIKICECS